MLSRIMRLSLCLAYINNIAFVDGRRLVLLEGYSANI